MAWIWWLDGTFFLKDFEQKRLLAYFRSVLWGLVWTRPIRIVVFVGLCSGLAGGVGVKVGALVVVLEASGLQAVLEW